MISRSTRFVILAFFLVTLAACGAPAGPQIEVKDVWSRPAMMMGSEESSQGSMGMGGTGAVFMQLVNNGRQADRLIGGTTDVAETVEIHETIMENDVMKMQMLEDGLEVPGRGSVLLKPGSYHVMLIGMKQDLKPGDTFAIALQFESSGTLTVQPTVREP